MSPNCNCQKHDNCEPYFRTGETNFVRCKSCGILFRQPMPSLEDLDAIYADLYDECQITSGQTNQESSNYALSQYAEYLSRVVLAPGSVVLDYGCGTGVLVQELRMRGIHAIGVERSESAREFAHTHRGIKLLAQLDDVPDVSIDAVTMIEVIEHLPDPCGIVAMLMLKLRPGGMLFVTTPNLLGLRARIEGGYWREAIKKFHVVLFDTMSLHTLLRTAGFSELRQIWYSPIQRPGTVRRLAVRVLQTAGLAGSLCVVARKAV